MPSLIARLCAVAAAVVLLAPAGANAKIFELGSTSETAKPACQPGETEVACKAITRTTAYQVNVGADEDLFVSPRTGRIVAWTVQLGKPTKDQVDFFESNFGGAARAGISVLEQQAKGSTLNKVVANSGIRNLTPFFGRRVQFPLVESVPIERGQRVALTVPSWAPTFGEGFDNKTAWRASRTKDQCDDNSTQTALLAIDLETRFQCFYSTARLFYTVTVVTEPKVKKKKKPKTKKPAAGEAARGSVNASGV